MRSLCLLLLTLPLAAQISDLAGKPVDPFAQPAPARVFVFVRTDCPITNRYAPELRRIAAEYEGRGAQFWLVYPDRGEQPSGIKTHIREYGLPGTALRDPQHELVKRAQAAIAPEAAIFDASGRLAYVGRIDDLYVSVGKSRPAPTRHDLEDAIGAVLAHKPVAQAHTQAVGCYLADIQ